MSNIERRGGVTIKLFNGLSKITVNIICDNGGSGTGFFFNFKINEERTVPTLVTNRHVIENVNDIRLILSANDYFENKEKNVNKFEFVLKDIQPVTFFHSDPEIDLCAIPITVLYDYEKSHNIRLSLTHFNLENIPSDEDLESLDYVEDVVMVGYPNGISDRENNMPIFRKGITASHPVVDFEGKPECLVDMTITPGSSGSPVLIYKENKRLDVNGNLVDDNHLVFLGVNKAVYTISSLGEIVEIPAPAKLYSNAHIGINLGIIIKAKALYDIYDQIIKDKHD